MIDPKIEQMPFTKSFVIRSDCKMIHMPKRMKYSFLKVINHLESRGQTPTEAPFSHYTGFKWEEVTNQGFFKMILEMFTREWHFESGFPLKEDLIALDDMKPMRFEEGKVVTAIYKGPYHKIGPTYKALYAWVKEQGLKVKDECFEVYLNDPRENKPADLETKILIPVVE